MSRACTCGRWPSSAVALRVPSPSSDPAARCRRRELRRTCSLRGRRAVGACRSTWSCSSSRHAPRLSAGPKTLDDPGFQCPGLSACLHCRDWECMLQGLSYRAEGVLCFPMFPCIVSGTPLQAWHCANPKYATTCLAAEPEPGRARVGHRGGGGRARAGRQPAQRPARPRRAGRGANLDLNLHLNLCCHALLHCLQAFSASRRTPEHCLVSASVACERTRDRLQGTNWCCLWVLWPE